MKKVVRLTESDLIRIVKKVRIINLITIQPTLTSGFFYFISDIPMRQP